MVELTIAKATRVAADSSIWVRRVCRLLQYFEVRKEARASEADSLGKAKAVLSGADYS